MAGSKSMLFRAPRPADLPHVITMLNDIGSDEAIAKYLGVTPRTIKKYRKEGQAPRMAMLSLFWETTWGVSAINCEVQNEARLYYSKVMMLKRDNDSLKQQISVLEALIAEGRNFSANDHFFRVGTM